MWILAPRPGIELVAPELEGKVLTTGPPGESREHKLLSNHLLLSFHLAQQCSQKSRELTITAPIWAEQPNVLLWSRCIGVLSRNQLGSTLLSDSKEGPLPLNVCGRPLPWGGLFQVCQKKIWHFLKGRKP